MNNNVPQLGTIACVVHANGGTEYFLEVRSAWSGRIKRCPVREDQIVQRHDPVTEESSSGLTIRFQGTFIPDDEEREWLADWAENDLLAVDFGYFPLGAHVVDVVLDNDAAGNLCIVHPCGDLLKVDRKRLSCVRHRDGITSAYLCTVGMDDLELAGFPRPEFSIIRPRTPPRNQKSIPSQFGQKCDINSAGNT